MGKEEENKLTFFVSGSGGFIGRAVCAYLEKQGQNVVRYDRGSRNFHPILNCDCVIHLSAFGNHYTQTDRYEIIKRNILDLEEMLIIAQQSKRLKQFYNISSSSVTLPVQTMYSASKLFGETIINSLNDNRFVNVRPYSIFGEGEAAHRFIPTIIRCLNSGEKMKLDTEAKHDWCYVQSFIDLMFKGITDCGSGESYTNLEIVRILEKISGKTLNFEPVESLRNFDTKDWVCPTKNILKVDLFTGLKMTYDKS